MIEVTTERFADIECLHATPAGKRHAPLPTVLFWHGFTSSKEVYAYFAVALAKAGFRAVMPDADQHGARFNGDADYRLGHFWDILKRNIDETPGLEAAIREQGLVDNDRFAVAGASMGGMTTLGAMARYPQIACAACMMGSGYFMTLAQTLFPPQVSDEPGAFATRMAPLAGYDLSGRLKNIADRPLFIWHGEADDVVPPTESVRLVEAMREAKLDGQLTFLTEKAVPHRITPPALEALVAFFRQHL